MAGPRTKRKRPEAVTAPVPRRQRRDAETGTQQSTDPEAKELPPVSQNESDRTDEGGGEASVPEGEPLPSTNTSLDEQIKKEQAAAEAAEKAPVESKQAEDASLVRVPAVDLEALLSHRNLLLERVRQEKRAAQQRLDVIHEQDPSRKDETLEQEIANFKELSRAATSIARKQSLHADGGVASAEKRTSVSLRRGSSVGKRMNAALSTLVGTSSSSILAATVSGVNVDGGEASTSQSASLLSASVDSAAVAARGTDSQPQPPATLSIGTVTAVETTSSSASRTSAAAAAAAGRPLKKDTAHRASMPPTGSAALHQPPRKNAPQGSARSASAAAGHIAAARGGGGPKIGGATQGKQEALPHYLAQGRHPHHLPPPPPEPSVFCPETAQLRERKKVLEGKLKQLLAQRAPPSSAAVASPQSPSRPQPPVKEAAASAKIPQSSIHGPWDASKSNIMNRARRKTHWDYVLEELRWLATDVVEERKWKIATAKSIASAAVERGPAPLVSTGASRCGNVAVVVSNSLDNEISRSGGRTSKTVVYHELDADDLVKSKNVATLMGSMITELATVMSSDGGMNPEFQQEYVDALNRYKSRRDRLDRRQEPTSTLTGSADFERPNAVSPTENGDAVVSPDDKIAAAAEFEDASKAISQFVDNLVAKLRTTTNSRPPSNRNGLSALPFTISAAQSSVIETVEDIWQRVQSGVVIGGPGSSGKTVVACTLLWKFVSSGPQLIVCAPLSVVRWMHELGRFDGVRRRMKALDAGISSPTPQSSTAGLDYGAYDVVVCDFATVSTLTSEELTEFRSVVIDTRYSRNLMGLTAPPDAETPSELVDPRWWTKLAGCSHDSRVRRLLIDSAIPSRGLRRQTALSDRQQLEILALRLVFLTDATVFEVQGLPLAKSVLKWARQRIKGSNEKGTKLERTRRLLLSLSGLFRVNAETETVSTELESATNETPWELHHCEMTKEQRIVYKRFCRESQATLSTPFDPENPKAYPKTLQLAADVLFHLRQLCFHFDLHRFATETYHSLFKAPFPGSSQPDSDVSKRILKGSGKLQRLVSFLVSDCNLKIADLEGLEPLLVGGESERVLSSGRPRKSPDSAKRVVILGSLPESLLLVTCLLYSLGVDHDCLLRPLMGKARNGLVNAESRAVCWASSQLALARFNDDSRPLTKTALIVTTLDAIAGDYGALGVDSADIVISLDENWSGQSQRQLNAVASRCHRRSRSSGTECRFVKFIAAESCESAFLSSMDAKPLEHRDACMDLHPGKHQFAYPAANIHAVRGCMLSSVLRVKLDTPRLTEGRQESLFLPIICTDAIDMGAVVVLTESLKARESEWNRGLRVNPLSALESLISLGRRDLTVLPSRLHLTSFRIEAVENFPAALSDVSVAPLPLGFGGVPVRVHTVEAELALDDAATCASEASLHSFLFYGSNPDSDGIRRANEFACTFSRVRNSYGVCLDGHFGQEALVYHPPLFPRLLECSDMAASRGSAHAIPVERTKKRSPDDLSHPTTKRLRLDSDKLAEDGGPSEDRLSLGEPGMAIEIKSSFCDAASLPSEVDDDFGLAGPGALPLPSDSVLAAASTTLSALVGIQRDKNAEWFFERFPSDPEESQRSTLATMDSMILFVSRKRSRGHAAKSGGAVAVQRLQTGGPVWASGVNAASQFDLNEMYLDLNGARKKLKKKQPAQKDGSATTSAFNRPPMSEHSKQVRPIGQATMMGLSKSKDAYRSRLLLSLRQATVGGTLFVAPSFRTALERVRLRVSSRLRYTDGGFSLAYEASNASGFLQRQSEETGSSTPWMSVAEPLKSKAAVTGELALQKSEVQATTFRRSLTNPCSVDFGPFHCGYLSSNSGMSSVLASRPSIGVSLPMGVKLSAQRDGVPPSWSTIDNQHLRFAVHRFGANWGLASRVVCGFNDVFIVSRSPQSLKSPRMCRDQWQKELKNDDAWPRATIPNSDGGAGVRLTVSAKEFSSSMFPLDAPVSCYLLPSTTGRNVSLGGEALRQEGMAKEDATETNTGKASRRNFDRVLKAKAMRQSVPLSMPGVVSGSPPGTVASHPSHMQAVQASAAFSWSNGRTEMWPLQLLDAADRQRASLSAAASVASAATAASRAPSLHAPGVSRTSIRSESASVVPSAPHAPSSQRPALVRVPQRPPSESTAPPSSGVPTAVPQPSSSLAAPANNPTAAATSRPLVAPGRPPPSSMQSFLPPSAKKTLAAVPPPQPLPLSSATATTATVAAPAPAPAPAPAKASSSAAQPVPPPSNRCPPLSSSSAGDGGPNRPEPQPPPEG